MFFLVHHDIELFLINETSIFYLIEVKVQLRSEIRHNQGIVQLVLAP